MVQATYLTLAVLMGGGLVFFGIGGEVSGGLFDAFSDRGGNTSDNGAIEERVKRNEARVKANPSDEKARKELVRDYYSLATTVSTSGNGTFGPEAQDELRKSAANWEAYLALNPKRPDPSLARTALQLYDPNVLNKPKEAKEAARLIAQVENSPESYLNLVQYAALAGDTRLANLAGTRAVDLAPRNQRKQVAAQVKQLKKPPPASGATGAAPQGAPAQP